MNALHGEGLLTQLRRCSVWSIAWCDPSQNNQRLPAKVRSGRIYSRSLAGQSEPHEVGDSSAYYQSMIDRQPFRWPSTETARPEARQQARPDEAPGTESPGSEVDFPKITRIRRPLTTGRTHRERKEQYMRALETEVSRLREAYTNEISDANATIQQQKEMVHSMQEENTILKDILSAHGIQWQGELDQRRAERAPMVGLQPSPITASSNGSHTAGFTQTGSHQNTTPPTTISTGLSPRANGGVDHPEVSPPGGYAPQQQVYHASSSEQPLDFDQSACQVVDHQPVPVMRGIFEDDPQLQTDFILTYVPWQSLESTLCLLLTCKQTGRTVSRTHRLSVPTVRHPRRRRGHAVLWPRPDGHLPTPQLHCKYDSRTAIPAHSPQPAPCQPLDPPESQPRARHRRPDHTDYGFAMSQKPRTLPHADPRRCQDHH